MNPDERFELLWTDFLEGDLDAEGMAELQSLLAQHSHLQERATDLLQTHRLLGFAAQEERASTEVFAREVLNRLPKTGEVFVGAVMRDMKPAPPSLPRFPWLTWRPLTAAAAGIVLGMLCTSVVFGYSMPRLAQRVFELANPEFELGTGKLPSGLPRRVGIWSGDEVEIIVRPDLKPSEGAQVLRFVKAEIQEGLVRSARSCDVFQLIDLRSLRDHIKPGEEAALELSADFLDARGAPGPTVRFACALMLFAGDPAELHTDWPAALDDILSAGKDQIDCGDGLAGRWHRLTARCVFPLGADFALLRVNVAQVNPVPVEFGQQFADNVKLVLKTHRALNMIAATGR